MRQLKQRRYKLASRPRRSFRALPPEPNGFTSGNKESRLTLRLSDCEYVYMYDTYVHM